MQKYKVQEVYKKLRGDHNVIHWDKLVWNRLSVPKHRVISWLVMHGRLRTNDVLVKIGVVDSNQCRLCEIGVESHDHLFFQCEYSIKCLEMVKSWLKVSAVHNTYQRQMNYIQRSRRSGVQKKFMAAVFSGLVYHIWWVRNEAIWNQVVCRPEAVFKRLKQIIQQRIKMVHSKKLSIRDQRWINSKLEIV
ncbi:uncharacterized protein LOC104899534 [Beta vulgaris subsp. vulgaris]|uniref:uncharacterized protein LOC104899534 n=1 Tax=Beta vulgaris subsp. vulgaris TaxID=3555 RepID=UPI0020372F37|nr:uncharacterized protein LOC104899534 [Beta vulgaris subsp. vulgaris]